MYTLEELKKYRWRNGRPYTYERFYNDQGNIRYREVPVMLFDDNQVPINPSLYRQMYQLAETREKKRKAINKFR